MHTTHPSPRTLQHSIDTGGDAFIVREPIAVAGAEGTGRGVDIDVQQLDMIDLDPMFDEALEDELLLSKKLRQYLEAVESQTLPHQLVATAPIHLASGSLHLSPPYLALFIASSPLFQIANSSLDVLYYSKGFSHKVEEPAAVRVVIWIVEILLYMIF
jgi:hypothetical protein